MVSTAKYRAPGRERFHKTIIIFKKGVPATFGPLLLMGEPEVGGPVAIAAEMCVSAPSSASAAGAFVPVSASERYTPSADDPYPASAEAAAAPGFVWRLTGPASARTFCPPWHFLS